jgi:hypothetical protein
MFQDLVTGTNDRYKEMSIREGPSLWNVPYHFDEPRGNTGGCF